MNSTPKECDSGHECHSYHLYTNLIQNTRHILRSLELIEIRFLFLHFFFFFGQIGNASLKNRAFTDTNDASFDSSYSAYLQETKQQLAKVAQPPLNLSQSLSNIVDVSGLSLAKDKYFERPSMVRNDYYCEFFPFFVSNFDLVFVIHRSIKNICFPFFIKFHEIDSILSIFQIHVFLIKI